MGTPNGVNAFNPSAGGATYSVSATPTTISLTAGHGSRYAVTVSSANGYSLPVNLSVSGVPAGVTASLTPSTVTPTSNGASSTLSISTAPTAPGGVYALAITGTGTDANSTGASTRVTLDIANYTVGVNPSSVTVNQGSSTTDTVTVTSPGGYNYPVTLSASGLPAGVTASFTPSSVVPTASGTSSTLNLSAALTTAPGTYSVTVTGVGQYAAAGRSSTLTLIVRTALGTPAYSINSSPSQSTSQGVTAGQAAQYTVTLSTSNGYASPVNLSVSGLPTGTSASFDPESLTPTSSGANATLTVTTANGAPLGTYTLTITGTGTDSAATKASTTATLVLRNYWMSASAYTVTLKAGTSGSVLVYANTTSGDYLQVGLAASGLPSGATASFNPRTITTGSPGTTPSTLTISTSTATPAGTYKLGVTGTDSTGGIRHTFINFVVQ